MQEVPNRVTLPCFQVQIHYGQFALKSLLVQFLIGYLLCQ